MELNYQNFNHNHRCLRCISDNSVQIIIILIIYIDYIFFFFNIMHLSRNIKLTDNIKTNIDYIIFFFNTIHLSRSIKITDNLITKIYILYLFSTYNTSLVLCPNTTGLITVPFFLLFLHKGSGSWFLIQQSRFPW